MGDRRGWRTRVFRRGGGRGCKTSESARPVPDVFPIQRFRPIIGIYNWKIARGLSIKPVVSTRSRGSMARSNEREMIYRSSPDDLRFRSSSVKLSQSPERVVRMLALGYYSYERCHCLTLKAPENERIRAQFERTRYAIRRRQTRCIMNRSIYI